MAPKNLVALHVWLPDVWLLLQPGCLLTAVPLQMAEVSRLVIKAMVYWCTGVHRYELYERQNQCVKANIDFVAHINIWDKSVQWILI